MVCLFRAGGFAAALLGSYLLAAPASRAADDDLHRQMVAARVLFRGTVGHRSAESLVFTELANAMKPGTDAGDAAKKRRERLHKLAQLRIGDDRLQADEDELVRVRRDLRDARRAVIGVGLSAFAEPGDSGSQNAFYGWYRTQMLDRIDELEARAAQLQTAIAEGRKSGETLRKQLGLPGRAPALLDGVTLTALDDGNALSWRDAKPVSGASGTSTTKIIAKDKSVIVSMRSRNVDGAAMFRPDIGWMNGRVSFLGSGEASGEGGQEKRVSAGAARRVGKRAAVSVDMHARFGNYALNHLGSRNEYQGLGATAGFRLRLAKNLNAEIAAYGTSTWTGVSGSSGSGAYRADTAGLHARMTGRVETGRTVITPSMSARYKWTDIGAYKDAAGTYVPSQKARSGQVDASLRLARKYDSPLGHLDNSRISPYVEFGLARILDKSNRAAVASESSLEKGHSTAKAKLGAETSFGGGQTVNLSGYMLRRLDNNYREIGTRMRLAVKF